MRSRRRQSITFDDEEQAIEIANNTQCGLAAGVWAQSIGTAFTMAERLEGGAVWVNTYRAVSYLSPPGCDYPGPFARVLQAKMSIHYVVASALLRG